MDTLNEYSFVRKTVNSYEPYENLISLVQRWHHTFQHFWPHFLRLFSSPWKARETAMADQQKHLDWRFVHFTEDLSAFAPSSHSKKHLQLHWGSSISKYWVYSLYGVLMCFGAGSHLLYNTDRTQPKTNESTPCMVHVQRSSSCALSKWSNEWRAHRSRSQATWAEAWFRVILCSALSGIHNPTFEQRVGEKPMFLQIGCLFEISCVIHIHQEPNPVGHAVHAVHAMPRKSDVPIPSSHFFVTFSAERIRRVLADP